MAAQHHDDPGALDVHMRVTSRRRQKRDHMAHRKEGDVAKR